jgi:probable selenium-dependent hydroxylase accessory protein YqeC
MASNHTGERLLELLCARRGLVCAAGAGGKKTTLYRLAGLHPGRVGLSATVFTLRFPCNLGAELVIAAGAALEAQVLEAAAVHRKVAFAQPSAKPGRVAGVAPEMLRAWHRQAGFDVTYIKADGARMRGIKAPSATEPVIPAGTATLLYLVSAHVIGQPLDADTAHRPERLTAVTGCKPGEPIRPDHVGRLLAAADGAFYHAGDASVVPIINMVDDDNCLRLARQAAAAALAGNSRLDRVVLSAMRRDDPVREVVWA